jgi:hypothetical protein
MAAAEENVQARTSSEFVDETILEAFVPSASDLDIQNLLESWDGEVPEDSNSIVPFIEQRPFLLLGTSAQTIFRERLLLITGVQMKWSPFMLYFAPGCLRKTRSKHIYLVLPLLWMLEPTGLCI